MKFIRFLLKAALAGGLSMVLLVVLWVGALVVTKNDSKVHGFLLKNAILALMYMSQDGRLELAVTDQDVGWTQDLLRRGANPNRLGPGSDTLLMHVCQATTLHSYELAQALLEHGANPNLKDEEGYTALMFAAQAANEPLEQLLLQHGARADAINSRAETFAKTWHIKKRTLLTPQEEALPQPATNRTTIHLR